MKWLGDLKAVWTVVVGTAIGVVYMFNTFATAADMQEVYETVTSIEVQLIKQEIRELRREIMVNHLEPDVKLFLKEHLAESILQLCEKRPEDKECK